MDPRRGLLAPHERFVKMRSSLMIAVTGLGEEKEKSVLRRDKRDLSASS